MDFGWRLPREMFAIFFLTIGAYVMTGADGSRAGICKQDGLINLYAANCKSKAQPQQPASTPEQRARRQASYGNGRRLQPVSFERAVVLEVESRPARGNPAGLVRLGVRCFRNETNLAFYFPEQEMSDYRERSEILYKVDDGDARVLELKLAGDSRNILGVWEGYRAVPFLVEILNGGSLYLNALDKKYSEVEVEFDLTELRDRIGTVRRHCSW